MADQEYKLLKELSLQLGDRVRIKINRQEVDGTVIAIDTKDDRNPFLVGWLAGERHPYATPRDRLDGSSIDPRKLPECKMISQIESYVCNEWIGSSIQAYLISAATGGSTHRGGMNCASCNNYNAYAQPNTSDGKHHCYQCRQRHPSMR